MKSLLLAFCLVLVVLRADAQTDAAHIKAEAQKCAQALLTHDYEQFAAYVPPRVLKAMGGKDAMIDTIKSGLSGDGGKVALQDVQIGEPEKILPMDSLQTALVPQKLVMKVPGGKLEANSYMLGVSEDDGKTWTFLDVGFVSEEQLATVYPEFKDKLHLPERQKPVFIKE